MSWKDVDETGRRGGGRYVSFEDGKATRLRVLDEEPFTIRVHKISQVVKKGDKAEEIYRSIPATTEPDQNIILQKNAKRYPDVPVFNLRVFEFKRNDQGQFTTEGEVKILQGGKS